MDTVNASTNENTKPKYYKYFSEEDINMLKNKITKEIHSDVLFDDISISTMTVICRMRNINFKCKNITRYINLEKDSIIYVNGSVKNEAIMRSVEGMKIKKSRNTPKRKIPNKNNKTKFLNQVSAQVMTPHKLNNKPISVKLFSNGSIQMTGCNSIESVLDVICKLLYEMKQTKEINDKKIKFTHKPDKITLQNINKIEIVMINGIFKLPFEINRIKLFDALQSNNIKCTYDSVKHSAVNIKYMISASHEPPRYITILAFEEGSIIITGASNCLQMNETYNFINRFILINIDQIIRLDIKDILSKLV